MKATTNMDLLIVPIVIAALIAVVSLVTLGVTRHRGGGQTVLGLFALVATITLAFLVFTALGVIPDVFGLTPTV